MKENKILTHPYHLVDPSPWPIFMSFAVFNLVIGLVAFMHRFDGAGFQLFLGLINVLSVLCFWWRDVIRESTYEGMHTKPVQKNLRMGVSLFILSEVMFFVGFFWAYFHSSLAPAIQIGAIWPPVGITPINPFGVPLLNTFILLTSGLTLTICHHAIVHGNSALAIESISITIVYAVSFIIEQFFEYIHSSFNINDGIYGSTFYMLTGFHGFHVIIGAIFICVCAIRLWFGHFTNSHHVGFEAAAWYWHFVDVVWLGLYVSLYWWGSLCYAIFKLCMKLSRFWLVLFRIKLLFGLFVGTVMSKYGFKQFGFQNSATPIAEGIFDLHDYIMFYIIIVFIFVFWVYFDILLQNLEVFNFQDLPVSVENTTLIGFDFILRRVYFLLNRINHATNLEIVWTLLPSLVLITIAIPSLSLLYSMDELLYPKLTLKVIGLQWYWMYEYSDTFVNNSMVLGNAQILPGASFRSIFRDMAVKFAKLQCADLVIESYMVPDSELNNVFEHRLLSTDNFILLPIDLHVRVLVTGSDVLHSWAVPSLGIKIDAVPGRLNQVAVYLKRQGIFYGQCSELCGVNHGFMPIVLKSVSYFQFLSWVNYSMSVNYLTMNKII